MTSRYDPDFTPDSETVSLMEDLMCEQLPKLLGPMLKANYSAEKVAGSYGEINQRHRLDAEFERQAREMLRSAVPQIVAMALEDGV